MSDQDKARWADDLRDKYGIARVEDDEGNDPVFLGYDVEGNPVFGE